MFDQTSRKEGDPSCHFSQSKIERHRKTGRYLNCKQREIHIEDLRFLILQGKKGTERKGKEKNETNFVGRSKTNMFHMREFQVLILLAFMSSCWLPLAGAKIAEFTTVVSPFRTRSDDCDANPDAPVCRCPCDSQLVQVTQFSLVESSAQSPISFARRTTLAMGSALGKPCHELKLPFYRGISSWGYLFPGHKAGSWNGVKERTRVCSNSRVCDTKIHGRCDCRGCIDGEKCIHHNIGYDEAKDYCEKGRYAALWAR